MFKIEGNETERAAQVQVRVRSFLGGRKLHHDGYRTARCRVFKVRFFIPILHVRFVCVHYCMAIVQ